MDCKKIEFKGELKIDVVSGSDIDIYWLVSKDAYIKALGEDAFKNAYKDGTKYRLYMHGLINFKDEDKEQHVTLRIVTD